MLHKSFKYLKLTPCGPSSLFFSLPHRVYSLLSTPTNELIKIREHLRQFGSENGTISFQLASEMDEKSPLSRLRDTTAIITLKNPSSRNALTGKMMAELSDIVDELENNPSLQQTLTGVILRGGGGFFCAGADIGIAKDHLLSKEGGKLMSTLMTHTLTRFHNLKFISVSAIEGTAIGGGAEVSTASDFRIISQTAKIRFVQAKMGVTPGWGGGGRLGGLVGRRKGLELLGSTKECDAEECLQIGLADEIVSSSSTMDDTLYSFLSRFSHSHPSVLHAAKEVVVRTDTADTLEEAVDAEHNIFINLWGGKANLEAFSKTTKKK